VNEACVTAAKDAHVAIFHVDRTIVLAEELQIIFPLCLCSLVLEWWHDIVRDHGISGSIDRQDAVYIVGFKRFRPPVVQGSDLGSLGLADELAVLTRI